MPIDQIPIDDIDLAFLRDVTLSDAYDYLEYMSGERPTQQNSAATDYGLNSNSRARKVSAIRAFFRYLTDKKHVLEVNPVSNLESPTIRKSLPVYLTADDSVRLLEAVQGEYAERDYCILTLFLNCGLRVSELVGLNLSDFQGDTVRVLGKGNKERTVYLNDACRLALENYLPKRLTPHDRDKNALFISRNRNRINVQTVKWLVKKAPRSGGAGYAEILRAQAAPHRGDADVSERRGHPHAAKHPRAHQRQHDHDLHPHRGQQPARGRSQKSPGLG